MLRAKQSSERRCDTDLKTILKCSHFILAWCHYIPVVAFSAAAFFSGYTWPLLIQLRYNVWSGGAEGCGTNGCQIETYYHTYEHSPDLVWVVPWFSIISGTHHLYAWLCIQYPTSCLCIDYFKRCSRGETPLRWADYAASSTLMAVVNAAMWTSPCLISTILFWVAVQGLIIVCGAAADVLWFRGSNSAALYVFLAACTLYPVAWATIWESYRHAFNGPHAGDFPPREQLEFDPPTTVHIILVWITLSFAMFPIVQAIKLYFHKSNPKYPTSEYNDVDIIAPRKLIQYHNAYTIANQERATVVYWTESLFNVLSFAAKLPLLAVFWTGLAMRADRDISSNEVAGTVFSTTTTITGTTTSSSSPAEDDALVFGIFFGVLAAALVGAVLTGVSVRNALNGNNITDGVVWGVLKSCYMAITCFVCRKRVLS